MTLLKVAQAGSTEKNDILVSVEPAPSIEIHLSGKLIDQYGQNIKETIIETLKQLHVTGAKVVAEDNGAIETVIMSRVQAAVLRSTDGTTYPWGEGKK